MRFAAAIVVLLVVAWAAPSAAARETSLCRLVPPLERLLPCPRPALEPSPATPTPAAAGSTAAAEPSPRTRGLTEPRVDPTRLLVRFAAGTSTAAAVRAAREAGGVLERRIRAIGVDIVRADADRLDSVRAELERSPGVSTVATEQLLAAAAVEPNDVQWPAQTGLRVARFAQAWAATRGSADTVVAVVDTGVRATHPDLEGAVLPGYDVVNGDDDAADDHGHGTAVAGVIAARANNRLGIAGVCWACRILPVKVLAANGYGPSGAVAAGIVWAADHDADVINISLGSPAGTEALTRAIAYAVGKGIVVVAAAGNEGVSSHFFPAAERGVVSVAATDDADRRYSWSNYGDWVAIAAPGCLPTTEVGGGYGVECGTSFASPVIAGLAALARSAQPRASAAEIVDAIGRGAVPIGSVVRTGRVDAARTFAALPRAEARTSRIVRGSLTARKREHTVAVTAGTGLLDVTAEFSRRRTLTVTILDAGGRAIARGRGRSPLRLSHPVVPGTYRVRVAGLPSRFTLRIVHAAPGP